MVSRREAGLSYIEMLVVCGMLAVLAAAVIPVVRWDDKRRKERQLEAVLTEMRTALDLYNKYAQQGLIQMEDVEQCADPANRTTCWPLDLESLVEGVEIADPSSPESRVMEFLPRIPIDPMTGEVEWGLRSYQDDWDATSWGGENVYDVYSLSDGQALDGTYYKDW